jgi:hypothetical protein
MNAGEPVEGVGGHKESVDASLPTVAWLDMECSCVSTAIYVRSAQK